MVNILITGAKSKLGLAFQRYVRVHSLDEKYYTEAISFRGDAWHNIDFTKYDVVLHCAGIYNAPEQNYSEYEKVNVDLTERIAKCACEAGIRSFIYLSTMDVYNSVADGEIGPNTKPNPQTLYGKSKLAAEEILSQIGCASEMKVSIIRCCPVIGRGAESMMEGYMKALKYPVFPLMFLDDKRSILHVDTLCQAICSIIDNDLQGVFFPQNMPPLSVGDILKRLKRYSGRKTFLIQLPRFLWIEHPSIKRRYSNLYYKPELSEEINKMIRAMSSEEAIASLFMQQD